MKAYGTIDEDTANCSVGYNYIIAILCRFISPSPDPKADLGEEMVFWCLFSIMNDLNWR